MHIFYILFYFTALASEDSSRTASASGCSSGECGSSRTASASEDSTGAYSFIPAVLPKFSSHRTPNFHTYSPSLSVGDIILLEKPRDHPDTDMWLGIVVQPVSKHFVKIDWITSEHGHNSGLWSIGIKPWEQMMRKNVLGKLTGWNGIGVMPEEITKLLDFYRVTD